MYLLLKMVTFHCYVSLPECSGNLLGPSPITFPETDSNFAPEPMGPFCPGTTIPIRSMGLGGLAYLTMVC